MFASMPSRKHERSKSKTTMTVRLPEHVQREEGSRTLKKGSVHGERHARQLPNISSILPDISTRCQTRQQFCQTFPPFCYTLQPAAKHFSHEANHFSHVAKHFSEFATHFSQLPNISASLPNISAMLPNSTASLPNMSAMLPNMSAILPNSSASCQTCQPFYKNSVAGPCQTIWLGQAVTCPDPRVEQATHANGPHQTGRDPDPAPAQGLPVTCPDPRVDPRMYKVVPPFTCLATSLVMERTCATLGGEDL